MSILQDLQQGDTIVLATGDEYVVHAIDRGNSYTHLQIQQTKIAEPFEETGYWDISTEEWVIDEPSQTTVWVGGKTISKIRKVIKWTQEDSIEHAVKTDNDVVQRIKQLQGLGVEVDINIKMQL